MTRFGRKERPPAGYEIIEPTLTALDNELREKINESHDGKRKNESVWPIHQINWQRSRYVYDMYHIYKRIPRQVFDYCVRNKIIDAGLAQKWRKPGYERLCSTYVVNSANYKFGTVSICRVPKQYLAPGTEVEDPTTGCHGCASGPGGHRNIFGNKYGQYLAAIQVAREAKAAAAAAAAAVEAKASSSGGGGGGEGEEEEAGGEDSSDDEDERRGGGVGRTTGKRSHHTTAAVSADDSEEEKEDPWAINEDEAMLGPADAAGASSAAADAEAQEYMKKSGGAPAGGGSRGGASSYKRART